MHNLGVAYGSGCGEMNKDYLLACHWLKKAAKQGDADAQVSPYPFLSHREKRGERERRPGISHTLPHPYPSSPFLTYPHES